MAAGRDLARNQAANPDVVNRGACDLDRARVHWGASFPISGAARLDGY
jgi:hypothetical protein